jgi:glucose/mannose transport system permease protein
MNEPQRFTASRLAIYAALLLAVLFFALPAWFAVINSL